MKIAKIMKRILFTLIGCCILIGCKSHLNFDTDISPRQTIDIANMSDTTINLLVDSIRYIGCHDIDGQYIKNITKLRFVDDRVYIYDFQEGVALCYDANTGALITILNKRGGGPEEYIEMSCFSVYKDKIYVVDNARRKLLVYDALTSQYISQQEMPIIATDMEVIDNNTFIFACVFMPGTKLSISQPDYRLFITDYNLDIQQMYFPYEKIPAEPIGMRPYFSVTPEKIIFGSMMISGFTEISRKEPYDIEQVAVKFNHPLRASVHDEPNDLESSEYINQVPLICGENIFISYSGPDESGKWGIWNNNLNALLENSTTDFYHAMIYPKGVTDACFVGFIDGLDTYQFCKEAGLQRAPESVEKVLEEEGFALAFYTLKSR